jgi:RHS repeat-associated protein
MNHRLQIAAALIAAVVATPLFAQAAPGTPLYRVTVAVYPGEDPAAAARRLAAMYRGQLETPVDAGGTFTIAVSESGAELLRRDPHVKLVEAVASRTPLLSEPSTDATTSWELGQYKYDGSGNIKQIGTDVFVYDTLGRVTSADAGTGHNQSYTYDGFANVRTITTSGSNVVSRPGVDPLTNRMDKSGTDASGHAYNMVASYDLRGNVRSYAGDTFEYDALDVVTKASVGGKWRSYVYTASDERIGTIELTSQNGTAVRSDWTLRDPNGSVMRRFSRESSGAWQWNQDYVYRDGQMLASELPGSPGRRYQYHLDHLGTPRLITGNGGVEISRHTYYAFGTEVPGAAPDGERKQFTGHERDSSTLDYMHARYYFPFAGRFLSVDPGPYDPARPQTWNRYVYADNNPILKNDPDGRASHVAVGGVIGGFVGLFAGGIAEIRRGYSEPVTLGGSARRVTAAILGGAVAGAGGAACGGCNIGIKLGIGATASLTGGVLNRGIAGDKQTLAAAQRDAANGVVGAVIGEAAGRALTAAAKAKIDKLVLQGAAARTEAASQNLGAVRTAGSAEEAVRTIQTRVNAATVATGEAAGATDPVGVIRQDLPRERDQ